MKNFKELLMKYYIFNILQPSLQTLIPSSDEEIWEYSIKWFSSASKEDKKKFRIYERKANK